MKIKVAALLLPLLSFSSILFAADKLVILSPHRKSIQNEFIPAFKEHYRKKYQTEVDVEWLDQGGTNDGLRFLRAKYATNPQTSGVDVFWGGGATPFVELENDKLLEKFTPSTDLAKQLSAEAAGVPLVSKQKTWWASAMSSFGIFFNKKLLKLEKLPEPATWEDLANPGFFNKLSQADPRKSGTANQLNTIALEALGWEKGWQFLTQVAGNTRQFTQSSSDPIKAVVSGDASATMAIDFYALAKIGDLGADKLGFVLPQDKTILDPDPIAILKGAPQRQTADRFLAFVLSAEAQALWMLPKGSPGGPVQETLGRLAVNTATYQNTEGKRVSALNPFTAKPFMKLDIAKAARVRQTFDDLLGAVLIDVHRDLKEAWSRVLKNGLKEAEVRELCAPLISREELDKLAAQWHDNVFRNKTINQWQEAARKRYATVGAKRAS